MALRARPARVLINAVAATMGGAATHLPQFLRGLGRLQPGVQLTAYVGAQWSISDLPANVRLVKVPRPATRSQALHWHLVRMLRVVRNEDPDVLVSLLNFGPRGVPVPHVLFERNPVYYCGYHLRSLSRVGALRRAMERQLLAWMMRGADRVIIPSAAMREMIRRFHPDLPEAKFQVVYHGFGGSEFFTGVPLEDGVVERLREAAGVRILYVSHAAAHKGVEVLLEAARILRDRGVPYTVWLTVDRADWPAGVDRYAAFIRRHGLDRRVVPLGRIPHAAIHRVYHAADLFAFPSLCESFGFPMVEAMEAELPIIAADTPVNREICGSAAVYYPPLDGAALADHITHLAGDPQHCAALRRAAHLRAAEFSWDRHVREVWDTLAGLLETARRGAGQNKTTVAGQIVI